MATESTKKRKGSVFDADVDVDELMRKFLHADLDDLEAFLRRQESRSELDYLSRRVSELLLRRNATAEQFGIKSTIGSAAPRKIMTPRPGNALVRKREQVAEGSVDIVKLMRDFLKANLDTLAAYIDARRGRNEFYLISQRLAKLDDTMKGLQTKFVDVDATILVSHVLPFVADRADYDSFRQASKALNHAENDNPNLIPPWPTQTLISSEGFRVQYEFSSDGNLIFFLRWKNKYVDDFVREEDHHVIIFHRERGFVKRFDVPRPDGCFAQKCILAPNCRHILLDRAYEECNFLEVMTFPEEFALKAAEPSLASCMVNSESGVITSTFSRDGGTYASVSLNGAGQFFAGIREISGESRELTVVSSFTGYETPGDFVHLCLSPDKRTLAMVTIIPVSMWRNRQAVAVFRPSVAKEEQLCLEFNDNDDASPIDGCVGIEYSPDGTILAGVHSRGVRFWNARSDYVEQGNIDIDPPAGDMYYSLPTRKVHSFSFLPCSKFIIVGTSRGRDRGPPTNDINDRSEAEIWNVSTRTRLRHIFFPHNSPCLRPMNSIRICPAGPRNFVVDHEGKVGMHQVDEDCLRMMKNGST